MAANRRIHSGRTPWSETALYCTPLTAYVTGERAAQAQCARGVGPARDGDTRHRNGWRRVVALRYGIAAIVAVGQRRPVSAFRCYEAEPVVYHRETFLVRPLSSYSPAEKPGVARTLRCGPSRAGRRPGVRAGRGLGTRSHRRSPPHGRDADVGRSAYRRRRRNIAALIPSTTSTSRAHRSSRPAATRTRPSRCLRLHCG
jgi:hypothetical protein